MKKELIVHQDPKSPISEIFRTLRTNIQFMDTKKTSKTILVTSTFSGEGKSWVSSNLAVTFAQTGKKVLIIDADMRKGRQYSIFGISPKPGLSNYLSGVSVTENGTLSEEITEYIQRTEIENLYVIAAGNIPPNPSELLIAPQMANLLEQAKQLCDVIVIDGTPSQLVTDSLILARIVDSTIVVTACNETKKEDLKNVIVNLKNVGGKISGVVLNKIPVSAKKYEQSYYYSATKDRGASESKSKKRTPYVGLKVEDLTKNSSNSASNTKNKTNVVENKAKDTNASQTKINQKEDVSVERINDILKQINDCLENEKKNLK